LSRSLMGKRVFTFVRHSARCHTTPNSYFVYVNIP
jgi:hypothetical protein